GIIHWNRNLPGSHKMQNSWNRQEWQPMFNINPAEDIPRKKRHLDGLESVRPAMTGPVKRQEVFVALEQQNRGHGFFKARLNPKGNPPPHVARRLCLPWIRFQKKLLLTVVVVR